MGQKKIFTHGPVRWNWAAPSGYGVPGKPITPDQFYTSDVFLMLVPDDGRGPMQGARTGSPELPHPPVVGGNVETWGPTFDPGIFADPNAYLRPGICSDPEKVKMRIERYEFHAAQLREALATAAQETDPQIRKQWEDEARIQQAAIRQSEPEYRQALQCRT